jgi:CheY-like chemotaxis protein
MEINAQNDRYTTYLRTIVQGSTGSFETAIVALSVVDALLLPAIAEAAGTKLQLKVFPKPYADPMEVTATIAEMSSNGADFESCETIAEPNSGTLVVFEDISPELKQFIEAGRTSAQRGKRVVVVDDDPAHLSLMRVTLTRLGFDVICIDGPLGATNVISKTRPRLVLLDLYMPALDGRQLCELLRRNPRTREIPILLYSSHPREEIERAAAEFGADGFIEKGSPLKTVLNKLSQFLGDGRSTVSMQEELGDSKAEKQKTKERRRHTRCPLLAAWRVQNLSTDKSLVGYVSNISFGGLAMYVDTPIASGTNINLWLGEMSTSGTPISGVVRWLQSLGDLYAIGIEFSQHSDRTLIQHVLEKV